MSVSYPSHLLGARVPRSGRAWRRWVGRSHMNTREVRRLFSPASGYGSVSSISIQQAIIIACGCWRRQRRYLQSVRKLFLNIHSSDYHIYRHSRRPELTTWRIGPCLSQSAWFVVTAARLVDVQQEQAYEQTSVRCIDTYRAIHAPPSRQVGYADN